MGFDAGVTVEVSLHVTVDEEPFTANIASVPHVPRVLAEVLLKVLLLPILSAAAGKLALEAQVTRLHLFHLLPDPLPGVKLHQYCTTRQSIE